MPRQSEPGVWRTVPCPTCTAPPPPADATFHGNTFDKEKDGPRLNAQMQEVFDLMRDGKWRTLREIAETTQAPEQSVSARLRDLRKPSFGGYKVERKRLERGIFQYRINLESADQPPQ